MGLDMYLERMPRYKKATAETVCVIQSYIKYEEDKKDPDSDARNYSMKEWCGISEKDVPPKDYIDFYCHFYEKKYSYWDTEHKYGYYRIMEEVGYWRKANSIHNWFVKNVQDGIDDCDYHHEVTKEKLEELLNICGSVLESCKLVGEQIKDSTTAEELLPTTCGFFFGSTGYDEYYIEDIKETVEIIKNVLMTTDFETEMVYYVSSW